MHKLRLIARYEYVKNVRRRTFLLVTFGMPVLFLIMIGVSVLATLSTQDKPAELGYVDQSGVLSADKDNPGFRSYATAAAAEASLRSGDIRAFYVVSADYRTSGKTELFYWDREPDTQLQGDFDSFLRSNLVAGLDPAVATRVVQGPSDVLVRSVDGSRQMSSPGAATLVLPFVLGLFFSFGLMNATGYLVRAVADEKESRTIEIMTTSVTPGRLIAGKALGLVAVALTQVFLWAVVIVGGLTIAAQFVSSFSGILISPSLIGLLVAYFIPLFALASTMVIVVGVSMSDTRQGQQLAGALSFLFLLPLFFSPLLGSNPDGPLMVVLTLFPTTSMLTLAVRWSATLVPLWQVIGSWLILVACAGIGIWLVPRVFRQGMLRYGQRMSLRAIVRAIRSEV